MKVFHMTFFFDYEHFLLQYRFTWLTGDSSAIIHFAFPLLLLSFKCFGRFSLIAIRENKLMTWYDGSMCYYRQDTIFKVGTSWYKIKGLKLILVMNTKRLINIFACSLTGIKIKFSFGCWQYWMFPSLFWLLHTHFLPSANSLMNRMNLQKLLGVDKQLKY